MTVMFINRLFYGIETSDEAFYDVTGYRMLKGNTPFGDMWELNATDGYFMLPFFMLHSFLFNINDGIHIYLRLAFFLLSIIGVWSVYIYAKQDVLKRHAFLLGTIILFYAPFQLYNFSYNNLSTLFVSSSLCMMLVSLRNEKKVYSYLSGLFMALGVLAYPTMVYCSVILAIVAIAIKRSLNGVKLMIEYAFGGITIAIPTLIHLSVTVGINSVIKNLLCILSAGSTPSLSPTRLILSIADAVKYLITSLTDNGRWFCLYIAIILFFSLRKKSKIVSEYLISLYPIICAYYSIHGGDEAIIKYILPLALAGPLAVLLADDRKSMLKRLTLEWGLSMMIYFVIAFSSGGGAANARNGLVFPAIVSVKLLSETMCFEPEMKYRFACIDALIMTLILGEILLFYVGVYRDEPYVALKDRIETGVYKGIYTTPGRRRHIEDLQEVMRQVEDKGETVMILYHSCYAYLMVDMIPKIPSTWGCIDYQAYGFDNQALFMDYLDMGDNIPENIIIIDIPEEYDYARQKVALFEPYYPELTDYISEHYTLSGTYEKGESGIVIKYEVDWDTFGSPPQMSA